MDVEGAGEGAAPLPFPFVLDAEPEPSLEEELAAGLGLEYRSLYHPLPLNETAGAEITRSRSPLQCGQ